MGIKGFPMLQDAGSNKSTAFTAEERERYGLRGLLPARSGTQALMLALEEMNP